MLSRAQAIEERITAISSSLDYNSQPIIPRPLSTQQEPALSREQRVSLLLPALSIAAESTPPLPFVEREVSDAYNAKALTTLQELQEQEMESAAILMQSCIRRSMYRSVYFNHTERRITTLPSRKRCCFFCLSRKQELLPEVDFSSYFDETTWLASPQQLKELSREELIPIVDSLQRQLLTVEDRLPCNNKVRHPGCLNCRFDALATMPTCPESTPTIRRLLSFCFHEVVCSAELLHGSPLWRLFRHDSRSFHQNDALYTRIEVSQGKTHNVLIELCLFNRKRKTRENTANWRFISGVVGQSDRVECSYRGVFTIELRVKKHPL